MGDVVARIGRPDALAAIALTVAGELEVLLGAGSSGERLVGVIALPAITLPLALRRSAPAAPLAAIALALPLQAALGGLLVEQGAVPLAALVLALYSAGRHVSGAPAGMAAGVAIVAITGTRLAVDPAVDDSAEAFWLVVYTPVPLLVGGWLRGQALLRDELREKGEQLERQRERNARHAAEAERMRIATDLESAVAGAVAEMRDEARELSSRLADRDPAARDLAARMAGRARETLADVRRILGVLRRGAPAPLTPRFEPATAAPRRDEWRLNPRIGDRGDTRRDHGRLVAPLIAVALVAPVGERAVAALTALLVAVPLHWRGSRPVAVVAAVLGAIAVQSAILEPDRFPAASIAAVVCATYALAANAALQPALAGLALALTGSALHAEIVHPDSVAAAALGGAALPWVAGRTVRTRRGLTAELRDRAARLEEAREEEAKAAMVAERARVARELHDAVAHGLSVVAIQAAGAAGIAERDPERAARTAALIESVVGDALAELGHLVAAPGAGAARPGLAGLDALARRARDGGLPVELRIEGEPAALPAGIDLAAFRIVQEALANVAKHARAAHARVVVRYARGAIELEVADDGRGRGAAAPDRPDRGGVGADRPDRRGGVADRPDRGGVGADRPDRRGGVADRPDRGGVAADRPDRRGRNGTAAGGGHGLIGMRERVALYDGTLEACDRPGGGFVVRARLPL